MLLARFMLFLKANPKVRRVSSNNPIFREISKLRYKVYCEEKNFLSKLDYPSNEETDEYDKQSVHIVATARGKVAGYCRVILSTDHTLPLFKHFDIGAEINREHSCEVSRFMIAKEFRADKLVRREIFRLLSREVLEVIEEKGIKTVFAVLEDWLLKSLRKRGYEFAKIGEGRMYMGAITHPTKMSVGNDGPK